MKKETDEESFDDGYVMLFLLLLVVGLFSFMYLFTSTYDVYSDATFGSKIYGKTLYQLKPDAYDWSSLLFTFLIVTELAFLSFSTHPQKKKNKFWHAAKEMIFSMITGLPISLIINAVVFYFLRNITDVVNGLCGLIGLIGTATFLIVVFFGWTYLNL